MSSSLNESNVHHFVPRSVLRRFAPDARHSYVFVFDKQQRRSWPGGLSPTGSGQGYNTLVEPDGTRVNFEPDFDGIDSDYSRIGNELAERRSLAGVDDDFLRILADVAVVQLLRTPLVRSTLDELPRKLAADLRERGFSAPGESEFQDENVARRSSRKLIARRERQRTALLSKDIMLFEPAGTNRFWTSDHPIATHSQLPLGETGLESLGVEIYLPIASDLVVGFLCPSLRPNQLSDHNGPFFKQADVVGSGLPLRLADAQVNFFNALQVQSSQRFLYASRDDFALARKILDHRPDLATNDSLIRMGKMGHAPSRPTNIPPGEWLYLESNFDYLLIPIRDLNLSNFLREMTTDRMDLLTQALGREEFVQASIFAERGGQFMRGAKVEAIDPDQPGRFRLLFADPSLQQLDAALARRVGPD